MALQKLNLSAQAEGAVSDSIIQRQHTQYQGIVQTLSSPGVGTADTLPTTSHGAQYMTQSITPSSASNILRVEGVMCLSNSSYVHKIVFLTKDAETNARATWSTWNAAQYVAAIPFAYEMVAGTTSSVTFKIWGAGQLTQTVWFNGADVNGADYGGNMTSHVTVWEIAA